MKLYRIFVLGGLALACLSGPFLIGQTNGGSVVGSIHDPSGAVVQKADITLTSNDTGTSLDTKSSSTGQYVFPLVPAGTYTLTVVVSGFETVQQANIIVGLNKTVDVDETLKVGSKGETVNVEALTSQLETTTSQGATTIDQQTFDDLPIAMSGGARSVTAIADLMPGVSDTAAIGYGSTGAQGQEFSTTINGGQAWGGAVMYDGIPFISANQSGDYRIQPVPVEALGEFSLVQNNFSAEYSRTPGGNLTYSTRAGGSAFHGQAYEYLRNTYFDSEGYFATGPTPTHQNEFGVNIGGPVDIPFLGLKKDKMYFFAFYSGFRLAGAVTPSETQIPSLAERTGDFSADPYPIYDPNSTSCNGAGVCTRTQYSYNGQLNVMPPSAISATGTEYVKYLPQPVSGLGNSYNFVATGVNNLIEDRWGGRVDYNLNDKNLLHGFFSLGPINNNSYTNIFLAPITTYGAGAGNNHLGLARLGYDHTFSPSLLLHLGYGWNYDTQDSLAPYTSTVDTFGIGNALPITPQFYMTQGDGFCCQAYADTGGGGGSTNHENTYIESGFISWNKGHHAFKFGGEYDRIEGNVASTDSIVDRLSGKETANFIAPGLPGAGSLDSTTGNSFASLMAGSFDSVQQTDNPIGKENRFQYLDAYLEDNWKVAPKLTLNLGIRYDIPYTLSVHDQINGVHVGSTFEPDVPNPGANNILGALVYQGTGNFTCNCSRLANTEYKLFQPRVGLAYQLDDKTVIHAGYGIYISINGATNATNLAADGFDATVSNSSPNNGTTPVFTTASGYPTFTPPPFINSTYDNFSGTTWMPRSTGLPAVINDFTLSIQRQLPAGFLLDVSYVGNTAQHLASSLDNPEQLPLSDQIQYGAATLSAPLNSLLGMASGVAAPFPNFVADLGGNATVGQALRRFPQYTGINEVQQNNGNSNYNSLQARLQRQFHNGLSLLTSFTYAKQMSTAESVLGQFNDGPQDTYGRVGEYTVALDQPPLNLTITYDYQLPFGYEKKYLSHGIAASLLGGWAVAGIHHYQSGTAMFETFAGNDLNIFNDGLRPNYVPGQPEKGSWSGKFNPKNPADFYFNINAFTNPAPNTFGNVSRDLPLRSFAYLDEDLSARKDFHIYKSSAFQFRTDFFNAFNRTSFASIFTGSNYATPQPSNPTYVQTFGTVPSQGNTPRTIQFSLKALF